MTLSFILELLLSLLLAATLVYCIVLERRLAHGAGLQRRIEAVH